MPECRASSLEPLSAAHADAWDAMIRDARKKILDLEYSIGIFQRRKANGEACPATEQLREALPISDDL
jgi:hypothetical protein